MEFKVGERVKLKNSVAHSVSGLDGKLATILSLDYKDSYGNYQCTVLMEDINLRYNKYYWQVLDPDREFYYWNTTDLDKVDAQVYKII